MAADRSDLIPLVSVASIAVNVAESDLVENDFRQVGDELTKAFTKTGFCYIKDHGVDENLLDKCFDVGKTFFALPLETKKRCLRGDGGKDYFGWLPKPFTKGIDRTPEKLVPNLPPDHKESFNLSDFLDESRFPTDDEVLGFRATSLNFFQIMHLLSDRVLLALGYGLKLEDPQRLLKKSLKTGTRHNETLIRYTYYPRILPEQRNESPQAQWCGEHTDFGLITFLLDNGVSGLEIKTRDGEYLMVPRQKGAFVVNIADSLERLTGGILRSAPHRVIITDESYKNDRYSVIYFRVAENSAYLEPLCGAKEKYREKITAEKFYSRRFNDIFHASRGISNNISG